MTVYHVCHDCTVAIVNADCSSYDVDIDKVEAFMKRVGYLVDAGMVPKPGYWDCESCDQTQIGSAHALETFDDEELTPEQRLLRAIFGNDHEA